MKHIQKLRKLILALGILAGMSLTAYATEYADGETVVRSALQNGDILDVGTIVQQAGGQGWNADIYIDDVKVGTAGAYGGTYIMPKRVRFDRFVNGTLYFTTVVTGITLDKDSATINVGDTEPLTLTATVLPDDAADKTVTWSSDNTSVATVDANGKVTAIAEGTATITVTATNGTDDTSDDKTATCAVTVVSSIVVVTAKADPYNTGAYYATFYDSTTSYTADCEVYYATANAGGRFTLEKAEGNVIKAGEGVILKATGENVTLTKTTTEASYDSLLTGSDSETTVENALVLSLGKNGVWFYKYSGTLGANKAYLAQ